MGEMVERVARGLCKADGVDPDHKCYGVDRDFPGKIIPAGECWPAWRVREHRAREAIATMRDPTEAMLLAAKSEDDPGGMFGGDGPCSHREAWQVMIDEALK